MSADSDPGRHGRGVAISETSAENVALGPDQEPQVLLRVVAGPRLGEFIPLKVGVTRIGRAASNDLVLSSESVSRYHTWIVVDELGLLVFDQSATNPTRVGDRIVVEPTAADPGDHISIGDTILEVLEVDAAADPALHGPPAVDSLQPDQPQPDELPPDAAQPDHEQADETRSAEDQTVDLEAIVGETVRLTINSDGVMELVGDMEGVIESPPVDDEGPQSEPEDPTDEEPPDQGTFVESTLERVEAALSREVAGPRSLLLTALHLLNSAAVVTILVLIARLVGGSTEADALFAADGLIDAIIVVSAALSVAMLPVERRQRLIAGHWVAADRLLWTLTLSTAIVMALMATVGLLFASQLAGLLAPGFSEATELTVRLIQIALVGLVVVAFDAGLRVLLHANRSFTTAEIARLLSNLAMISAIVLSAPRFGATAIVVGAVGSLCLLTIVQAVAATSNGLLVQPMFKLDTEAVRALLRLPGSVFLMVWPLAMLLIDRAWASRLEVGSLAAMGYGGRIALILLGVGLYALGRRAHPLPVQTVEGRSFTDRDPVRTIHLALTILAPLAVIVYLTRLELVDLILGRGAFGADEISATAVVLGGYAIGLPGLAVVVLVGGLPLGGRSSAWLAALSAAALVITAMLDAAVIDRWGMAGLALGSSAVVSLVAVADVILLERRNEIVIERPVLLGQLLTIGRAVTGAAIVASLVGWAASSVGAPPIVRLAAVGITVAVVYGWIGWMAEIGPIRSAFARRREFLRAVLDRRAGWSLVPSAGSIPIRAATVFVAVTGAWIVGAALAVIGGRLVGLERLLLGVAMIALPLGLSLRTNRGFDRIVFFALLIFGVVHLEPAPVDGLLAVLVAVGVLQGRLDLNRMWSGLPVVVSVGVMLALSLIAGMGADAPLLSLRYNIITIYCVTIMGFVRMYCVSTEAVDRIIRGYVIGGVVAVVAVLVAPLGLSFGIDILEGGRARGFTQDANVFGPFLVIGMFLAIDQIRRRDLSTRARRLFTAAVLISAIGIFLTFSRAAWGNAVLTTLVYLVLAGRTFSRRERVRAVGFLVAISFLLVVSTVATGQVELLSERAAFIQSYDNERFAAQSEGIMFGLNNPLGIGPGMTDFGERFAPHNSYIRAFGETGLVGFLALIAVYWSVIYPVARRVRISSRYLGVSSQVLVAIMVGQLANGFLIDTLHWRHFWLLLGLLWVQHDRLRGRDVDSEDETKSTVDVDRVGALA